MFALQSSEFCLLGYPRKGHKVLRVKVRGLHPRGIRHWTMGWMGGMLIFRWGDGVITWSPGQAEGELEVYQQDEQQVSGCHDSDASEGPDEPSCQLRTEHQRLPR